MEEEKKCIVCVSVSPLLFDYTHLRFGLLQMLVGYI